MKKLLALVILGAAVAALLPDRSATTSPTRSSATPERGGVTGKANRGAVHRSRAAPSLPAAVHRSVPEPPTLPGDPRIEHEAYLERMLGADRAARALTVLDDLCEKSREQASLRFDSMIAAVVEKRVTNIEEFQELWASLRDLDAIDTGAAARDRFAEEGDLPMEQVFDPTSVRLWDGWCQPEASPPPQFVRAVGWLYQAARS